MNILRAEAYLQRVANGDKLSEHYDSDEMLRAALGALFEDFEYPDFAHLTLSRIWAKYQKNPRKLT